MRPIIKAAAILGAVGLLVACSADGGTTGSGGSATDGANSKPFHISAVIDETGPGGFAGSPSKKGVELAVEEINAAGGIGGRKIVVDYTDSATNATQATQAITSAAANQDVDALIYGVIGSTALGLGPAAQSAGVPLVLLQAALPQAMEAGDFIFRTTYEQREFTGNVLTYWQQKGVKSISIVAHEDSASGMNLLKNFFIPEAEKRGFEVNPTHLARTTDSDYTSQAQAIIAEKPDAVYNQILGTPIVTIIQTLRNLGYKGEIGASVATAGGVLAPLGELANGVVYPNTFSYATKEPAGAAFAKAYEAKFNAKANNFAADGYDAVRLIAEGAKKAGKEVTRASLQKGMLAVTEEGLKGSPTKDPLVFVKRAASGSGVLVRWQDGGETLVPLK